MSRDEIRNVVKFPYKEFYRNEFSQTPTDSFDELNLFVNYDSSFFCEAIEVSTPSEVMFLDRDLLKTPFDQALKWIKELDPDTEEDDLGLTSYKFGFGLYAPDKDDEPHKASEGVIIFRKGYYN